MKEEDGSGNVRFERVVRRDARLEELSDKVRKGIPICFPEALEVIAYQEALKASRPKTWLDRVRSFFRIA